VLLRTLKDEILDYFKKRAMFGYVVLGLFFAFLALRLFYMQVISYEKFKQLSENNRIRIVRIKADRGFIKDVKGRLLVKNSPSYELKIVKEDVEDLNAILDKLAKVLPIDKKYAIKQVEKSYLYEPAVILRGLSFNQVAELMEHSDDYVGVEIGLEAVRSYMDSRAFSHILGYMSEVNEQELRDTDYYRSGDMLGKTGVEKVYEKQLRGDDGARQVEVDSYGRPVEILSEKASVPGENITLTVDYEVQTFLHRLMDGKKGAVVVMDVNNFDVLALYSAPAFDLNSFTPFATSKDRLAIIKDPTKPLLNRAIEGRYPPGSVYKVLMAVMGLMEHKINPDSRFTCTGEMQYGNFKYKCWKKEGHGTINLVQAIEESCDVYFYNLGLILGIDTIYDYSTKLSLGVKTGIALPNEKSGFFPGRKWKKEVRREGWYPGETIITSIGQGYMATTPIQIAVMLGGIFNGGNIYTPNLVRYLENPSTGHVREPVRNLKNKVHIDKWAANVAMKGMVNVVEGDHATGYRANVPGVHIGGKTGTAQVVSLKRTEDMDEDDIPEHYRDHSWFAAVFPADNPKYVAVAMIEHGGAGSKGAAPIVGALVNKMADLGYVKRETGQKAH